MSSGDFTRTGVCTLVDMSSLEIDVSESYINRVESGQPVVATLDAYRTAYSRSRRRDHPDG